MKHVSTIRNRTAATSPCPFFSQSRTAKKLLRLEKGSMQLFVRTDRTHTLQVSDGATAASVKALIANRSGLVAGDQRLVFGGQQLPDSAALSACGVSENSTLYLLGRLLGGGKKRKKKTYTKPKKIKHKHKKTKLRVLQFYKVDDSGKVQRLRKVCPAPTCGPGIFMATHFNRVYCGKCGLTMMYDKEGGVPST